jgi:hypothetical protein
MGAPTDWTANVTYPATKLELIDAAADGGAPQDVIERLQQLSHEQYESAADLEAELGGKGAWLGP